MPGLIPTCLSVMFQPLEQGLKAQLRPHAKLKYAQPDWLEWHVDITAHLGGFVFQAMRHGHGAFVIPIAILIACSPLVRGAVLS